MSPGPPGLFVTGTDTGVGKTHVAASIARALAVEGRSVGALKVVATGVETSPEGMALCEDASRLAAAIGFEGDLGRITPLMLRAPLAPPVAAREEGGSLSFQAIRGAAARSIEAWSDAGTEVMIVEGVGGWLCPIADDATVADLAVWLDYPVLVVARRGLGTLNHCLLTIEAIRGRGVRIAGVLLNGSEPTRDGRAEATNAAELSRWLGAVPLLDELEHEPGASPDVDGLLHAAMARLDWMGRVKRPRGRPGPAQDR
jgi:dethiobiotin synthetase